MTETETDLLVPRRSLTSERLGAIVTVIGPDGIDCRGRVTRLDGDHALVRVFERLHFPLNLFSPFPSFRRSPRKDGLHHPESDRAGCVCHSSLHLGKEHRTG